MTSILTTSLLSIMLSLFTYAWAESIETPPSASEWLSSEPRPILEKPKHSTQESSEHLTRLKLERKWYQLALLHIQALDLQEAERTLQLEIHDHPNNLSAIIQLGWILLWKEDYDEAYFRFFQALALHSSIKEAMLGLEKIALVWTYDPLRRDQTLHIYKTLLASMPDNPDLLFYTGRLLAWMGAWEEATTLLIQCLTLAPQYIDAELQLAAIYTWEGRLAEAEIIYNKYPNHEETQQALARLEKQKKAALCEAKASEEEPLIIDPPTIETPIDEEKATCLKEQGHFYALAQVYIRHGHLKEATAALEEALKTSPKNSKIYIQQGFVFLWQKKWDRAYAVFSHALTLSPCNIDARNGLHEIAMQWSLDHKKRAAALKIYVSLLQCAPDNPDYLFYYGRTLSWTKETKKAKEILLRCLELAPQYIDADLVLAAIYLRENNLKKAKAIYERYPDDPAAQAGLATIHVRSNNPKCAHEHFDKALKMNPDDPDTRLSHARFLMSENLFKDAQTPYSYLLNQDPYNDVLWRDMFEAKAHTDVFWMVESDYVEGQEHDPDIGEPVVKEYYFNQKLHIFLPARTNWLIDVQGLFSHQKENDIYIPAGTNFNVLLGGAQVTSSLLFAKYWRWDVIAREFKAWGSGEMFYPFQKTRRFEPGTNLRFTSNAHTLILDAHIESFIIKNYDLMISQLLKLSYIDAGYTFHPDIYLHPSLNLWAARVFYHDDLNNIRNTQNITFNFGLPLFEKFIDLTYLFEHSTFNKINPNYYSFKRQTRNTARITLHSNPEARSYIEVFYDRTWQKTHDLFQPIGSLVFIARSQLITENKIWLNYSYLLKDKARLEIGGYYYRDTLPSWYYNIKGAILWRF